MAIRFATKADMMVLFQGSKCIAHLGCMMPDCDPKVSSPGPICQAVAKNGKGNYLANLALFPGECHWSMTSSNKRNRRREVHFCLQFCRKNRV